MKTMLLEILFLSGLIGSLAGIKNILDSTKNYESSPHDKPIEHVLSDKGHDNQLIIKKERNMNNESNEMARNTKNDDDYYKITLDYCYNLSLSELQEYIDSNYDLKYEKYKIYGTCNSNDKYYIAKHIAELTLIYNKPFNNRFKRY